MSTLDSIREHMGMSRADRRAWQQATTLAELGELTARWLEGSIKSRPGYMPRCGPDPETTDLIPVLARLNRAGYVTEGSQPGEGPVEGWDGQQWSQRAGVSGFCDDATLARIREAVEPAGMVVIAHRTPDRRRWCSRPWRFPAAGMPVTATEGEVATVFGARMWLDDVETCFDACSDAALKAVRGAWQVTLVDPAWGSNKMWSYLMRATSARDR
jgi:hypothetical protein